MRDNHEGMPEIIRAFERDDHYFVIIEKDWGESPRRYQFGVSQKAYLILQRILQTRTFDMMPGLKYRYFYAGSSCTPDSTIASMVVRIEHERDSIEKKFEIPKELHANLLWFSLLRDSDDAKYLEINP